MTRAFSGWVVGTGLLLAWPHEGRPDQAPPAPADPAAYVTPEYIRRTPSLPAHAEGRPVWRLPLSEAIEISLRRNLALNLERERVRETDEMKSLALGSFEPLISASVNRNDSRQPPVTRQEGAAGAVYKSRFDSWRVGLSDRLQTGTELRVDFSNSLAESMLGTAVQPKVFRSGVTLGLTQPLLQDFSIDGRVQRAPILRAEFTSAITLEEMRLRAMVTVKTTEDAYWTLVENYKTYEVNNASYALAEKQLDLTRRQIAAGVLPESDVIGVEGTLAQRQLILVRTEVQIERAADQLRALMNVPPADWDRPVVPTDAPNFMRVVVPFDAALQRATAGRPELKQAAINLRRVALDMDVARNGRLPRLDLQGSYGTVGQDQRYGTALDQISGGQSRQWNAGLIFSWAPLGVAARAEIRRLESAVRQNALTREQLVVDMRAQLRDALRAIDTAERQVLASAKFRDLAVRSLDVEQRRFLNSLSDNFKVAQRQAELTQAQQAELAALIQHERAASDLQLALGELLEARHLKFELRPPGA